MTGMRGIVPVSRREGRKEGSARKGGKRKKMIEIEKKRQTIPII